MLTNSSVSKLKASKSSAELNQSLTEGNRKIEVFDKGGEGDRENGVIHYSNIQSNSLATKIYSSRDRTDSRAKSRPRSRDDLQMSQGSSVDRRVTHVRGRGGGFSRKVEREGESTNAHRGKFQEPLIKGSNSDLTLSSKYYDSESSKSRMDHAYNVPEDSRISKLLRRLSREDDFDKFLALCQQLQDSLVAPDNTRYIRRAFDDISSAMVGALHRGPGPEAKTQIALCLGRVGFVLGDQEFKRYMDWLFAQYDVERNDIKMLLLKAVQETVRLDKEAPCLKESSALMANLQTTLENTDLPELIMATVDVIVAVSESYPNTFTKHFRDTVDILVGWHIDGTKSPKVLYYASRSLQKLNRYWIGDMQFSVTLLAQFLEDMEAYGEDFNLSGRSTPTLDAPPTPEATAVKVAALIKVFNTVAKSLGQHLDPATSTAVKCTFLVDCLGKMLRTVNKALGIILDQDLIIAANECAYILLTHLQSKTSLAHVQLYGLIGTELSSSSTFRDSTLISMLRIIVKIIREVSGNLTMEFVQTVLSPKSPVLGLRFSPSVAIQNEVLAVFHGLLNLKNIPLLQEAYRHVLGDLETAYRKISPSVRDLCQTNPYADTEYDNADDAEMVVLFHLRTLTDLANATNSIIGMWALNPSIFELIARDLRPHESDLSPMLQYSLLYLLHSHCSKSSNFVSSSDFVSANQDRAMVFGLSASLSSDSRSSSPTSGHYLTILNLLSKLIATETSEETRILALTWSREVFLHSEKFFALLYRTAELEKLIRLVVEAGHCASKEVASRVAENVEQLLSIKAVEWKPELLRAVVGVCLFHLNSSSVPIRDHVARLLTMVPWDVAMPAIGKALETTSHLKKDANAFTLDTLNVSCRHHMARDSCGPMQPQHFRRFMGYLLQGADNKPEWLREMFCICWPVHVDDRKNKLFGNLSLVSTSVLLLWATWEAAQLCIMQKLRTPLGKPQDTFTSIEAAVKQLAREVSVTSEPKEFRRGPRASEPDRVRLLLEFLEHLEKAMFNAAEGCALAMTQPPKPVRTFFHTNKSTCAEWLTRVRMAVVVVATRAGMATTAVRHGHCLLQGLVDGNATNGAEFEVAVMYVCWALCKLREPAAILGLYAWCRDVSGRKFPWLKAAAHQSAGRHEQAAVDYRSLLDRAASPRSSPLHASPQPAEPDVDPQVLGFVSDQLAVCYRSVHSWSELHRWKLEEPELWTGENGTTPLRYATSYVTADHAKALQEFDDGDYAAACELMKWPTRDDLPDAATCWNAYRLESQTNGTLTSIAMNLVAGSDDKERTLKWTEMLDRCRDVGRSSLQFGLRNSPSEFQQEATVLQYVAGRLRDAVGDGRDGRLFGRDCHMFGDGAKERYVGMDTTLLTRVLWWGKCFEQIALRRKEATVMCTGRLQLVAARAARKEGNLGLARRLLLKHLDAKKRLSLEELATNVMAVDICSDNTPVWDMHKVAAYTEVSKLLRAADSTAEKAVEMCVYTALAVSRQCRGHGEGQGRGETAERSARLLMTLAKWLQEKRQGGGDMDVEHSALFAKLIDQEKARNHLVTFNVDDGPIAVPPSEVAMGYILQLATARCPSLSKTWCHYATWCYRWGKKMVEAPVTTNQLADADKEAVQLIMPRGSSQEEFDAVTLILSRTLSHDDDMEGGGGGGEGEEASTSETVMSQLLAVRCLRHAATPHQMEALVAIWRNARRRLYSYYQQAAVAYFKYLAFCDDAGSNDCNTIIATLRLLRMIVKHAMELQDALEGGLGSTPVRPWKVIIPQLFSRLSHPEPYVRTRVSELLCRVAEDAPHLITFPAVVGATGGGAPLRDSVNASRLFSAGLSQSDDDDDEKDDDEDDDEDECLTNEEEVSVLKSCFLSMVDTLSKQAPLAISQVQLVVSELHRITLLWDELWLGTLVQHHAEIARRLSQLEAEVRRVEDNMSLSPAERDVLIAEKHRIIMKPLVFILEQLHAITSVPPETPHEVWFQDKFSDYISESLQKLKCPSNPRKPHDSWHPFKILQSRLQHRSQKRAAYAISMADVSPLLAGLRDTVIAMPGVTPRPGKIITIAAVDNMITILPTKTKPKKLVFHGNDGQMYTYLFKGLEDLHLDERIMQFLSIANTMLASERGGDPVLHRARHYSVIPLGPRSGLISWVDGVTPLFGLYKRWQQREIAAGSLKGSGGTTNQGSGGTVQVMRPSEMFYSKLTPMLKEKGITNLENRKEWPLPILRQVLTELMDETPKDLLAKELWCHSVNAGGWWRTTRTYSYSVAVMSIIGYIIGLGDRHLDNVLVDLNTGEVVHIDYNVCFEKGKTLRVPEKVPFRMTQNIRAALGVTGVEGIFRLTCEHVLKVMKKGRETLLTLLEAFVYDPLIDWTPGNETGYTGAVYGGGRAVATETKQSRKQVEHDVTRAMFCVRATEMRADWLANRDHVAASVTEVAAQLEQWLAAHAEVKAAEEALQDCHQQMALLKEAEAQGPLSQHSLYTLAARYSKHRHTKEAVAQAQAALADRVAECDRLMAQHGAALAAVRGPALSAWIAEVNYPQVKDVHLVFDLVKEFLASAGQGPIVSQCEQSEAEVGQLALQQTALIRTCLDRLTQYKSVVTLYPASYIDTHRATCYRRWAARLSNNMTVESCQEVRLQFSALFAPEIHSAVHVNQQVLACSFQQQAVINDANIRIQKWYDRLTLEGSGDINAAYMEAKAAITAFPHSEKGAALALECVNVTALCALNQRYTMMETAAFCAGDSVVDLQSREGDWFLDEMYVVSTSMAELSSLIPPHHSATISAGADTRVPLVLQCIQSSHGIYKSLQELNFNFYTIILPEAVERIQAEEPSVLAMIANLNQAIAGVGGSLNQLLAQLEKHLRCIIMEMESPHGSAQAAVAQLSARFKALTRPTDTGSEVEPGMMLLMGFNGLFEKLHNDGNALVAALDTIKTPACWRHIDQIRDAKGISAPVFNDTTRGVLEDIFLLRRLQTMQDFFTLCCQMAVNCNVAHDNERLMMPIRRYTADYVSRRLLGVMSQTLAIALCMLLQRIGLDVTVEIEQREVGVENKVPLEELCRKAVDMSLKLGLFSNNVLAQASSLTSNLESSWRRKEIVRRLQLEVEGRRSTLKRLHYQLTAYHWLHEDSLAMHGPALNNMIMINRSSFMLDLRQAFSSLVSLQPSLTEKLKQQKQLVAQVGQRLRWGAGANPALTEVLAAFESALEARDARLANEQRLAVEVAATCNALVHHEALRTRTTEAVANDTAFVQLMDQCEKSCQLAAGYEQNVTPLEESLVQLLLPEGSVDHTWIHNVERLISGSVKSLQQQMTTLQDGLRGVQEKIKAKAMSVRGLMNVHHKLMADVKNLVKPMMKYEDADLSGLPAYWAIYRAYTDQLSTLIRDLTAADLELDTASIHQMTTQLLALRTETAAVYKGLLLFGKPWEETRSSKRPPLVRQESVCLSPRRGVPAAEGKKASRDPHTGKAMQERNAYAVNVWRKVRTKFEGRDPDLGRKVSNTEQVDYVIREATNLDNLSLLYEGWTPWV